MIEVRIHGRYDQGVMAATEILAIAASLEGRYAQALPGSGAGRADGEVVAFCRIDDREILTHEPVTHPDAVIVLDHALLDRAAVLDGLRFDGYLLVNYGRRIDNLGLLALPLRPARALTVPATELARKFVGSPVPNAALIGGFAAMSGVVTLDSVLTAIRQRFAGPVGKTNATAATAAFAIVRTEIEELTGAPADSTR